MPHAQDSVNIICAQLKGLAIGVPCLHLRAVLESRCDAARKIFENRGENPELDARLTAAEWTVRPNLLHTLVTAVEQWSCEDPFYHPMVFGVDMWDNYANKKIVLPVLQKNLGQSPRPKVQHLFLQVQLALEKSFSVRYRTELAQMGLASRGTDAKNEFPDRFDFSALENSLAASSDPAEDDPPAKAAAIAGVLSES